VLSRLFSASLKLKREKFTRFSKKELQNFAVNGRIRVRYFNFALKNKQLPAFYVETTNKYVLKEVATNLKIQQS